MAVIERLFWYLLIIMFLLTLFFFSRKRFRQVILIGALSVVGGFVIRLFRPREGDSPLILNEIYFLLAIGLLYGLVWLGTRYLDSRSRTGTHRHN